MLLGLLVSLLAGLATSVGGALVLGRRALRRPWLAVSLAFAAGAMVLLSLVQILPLATERLAEATGSPQAGLGAAFVAFFVGIALVMAIDRFLPTSINPAETEGREDELSEADAHENRSLLRSGLLVGFVLALHNVPEGMATFLTTWQDPRVGLTLGVAIAIHNIPEGIAVAAPVYAATGSRRRALWWATASGLTEPLGGLAAAALVTWLVPPAFFGLLYGLVAGMMVFLALDELLPGARRYQTQDHQSVYGMVAGMAVVAVSLILFAVS